MSSAGHVVLGAGPAGLAAALELTRHGVAARVFEADATLGGLARTEVHGGFRFDLGGHRFYTRSREVMALWQETLGRDFLVRPRLSRIYYRGRFFPYPLELGPTLATLGPVESLRIAASYLRAQLAPASPEESFEDWVSNRFGRRLYRTFFQAYTQKVWGIPCTELRADWAAQRLRGISVATLAADIVSRRKVRSLAREFHYPRLGPGMMWEGFRRRIEAGGGTVTTAARAVGIGHQGGAVAWVAVRQDAQVRRVPARHVISSLPLGELVAQLDPPAPADVRAAASRLRHRAFLTVGLAVEGERLFPDNWVYVHDPGVRVGRIQNYGNWSPDMVPGPGLSGLGLEYFCDEGDELWSTPDHELVELARRELKAIGLAGTATIGDGCVYRARHAYPVYDRDYASSVARIRAHLDTIVGLATVGRNGLHRYNNQDHSMLTGLVAARNAVFGQRQDVWAVNADQEYLEETSCPLPEVAAGLPINA